MYRPLEVPEMTCEIQHTGYPTGQLKTHRKIEKMIEMAKKINANVLGENDEKYYLSKDY